MSLDAEQVRKIADLAQLAIAEQDIPGYARNLSEILDFVDRLAAVDTHGVTPMAHPLDLVQRLRDDVPFEPNRRDTFQAIAPQVEAGLYLVPKVIE